MMWGDRSPRAKLTGDSRRGFEAVLIGDCRSFRSLARNWPLRLLRLLQQYRPKADLGASKHNSFDQPDAFQLLSLGSYNDRIIGGDYAAAGIHRPCRRCCGATFIFLATRSAG